MKCAFLALVAFAAAAAASLPAAAREPAAERHIEVRVDPRIELLSIVFRLAGNPEYAQGEVKSYTRAVDAQFGKLRDHAVVKHAAELYRTRGVSYDAVMTFAVHLDDAFRLDADFAKSGRLDSRWPADEARRFAEELRAFARAGDAKGFFRAQRPLYELTAKRMQTLLDERGHLAWFDSFFGARPGARLEVSPALGNGCNNYGPSVLRADGTEELYCVLGVWATDAEGKPSFADNADVVMSIVIHEFSHSYANPLVAAHMDALAGPGKQLWPPVADAMKGQAYSNFETMLMESFVRASTVRYLATEEGAEAAKREIDKQHALSFLWTGEFTDTLATYEQEREKYKTLDAFMPRIAEFFADYAKRFEETLVAAPKVARMEPPNGATDVDSALTAITVTFDRPMRDGLWAMVGGGPNFPKLAGELSYDSTHRVMTIPVELAPSWDYEFWLNRGEYDSFQSEDGIKLLPVHVTFSTRAKRFEETLAATPKVARMEPPNGATDVDPALTAITVTFDRTMRDGAWAMVGGGPNFPKLAGELSYDSTHRVMTIPVELAPSRDYEFWLNRGEYDSFQSEDGVKLLSVHVTFSTRAK